jgi:cna B domain protein
MKHSVMSFLAIVATLSSLISCQKEIETPKDDIKSSHTVSFVADAPRTKTNATVDGNKVNYSWTKGDEDKFKVYEIVGDNHTPASTVKAILKDGLMEISAIFGGEAISGASYQAVFNTGVKTVQTNNDETGYDQDSDVLVSEVVSDPNNDFNNGIALKFKRLVAVNKATLKNLKKGDFLSHTIIETTDKKDLAGEYSNITNSFESCKSKISVETLHGITGGTAPVNFITLPIADTKLKVTAVTIDGNNNFVAAYEKTFSKGISLTQGNLTSFGVLMSEKTGETIDLSKDETTTATTDELTWDRALVHVKVLKGKSTIDANNYYPGKSKTSTRFYKNSTLAITPRNSLSISEIVFTATTDAYAAALANSTWTNATASASGKTVSIIPTDGTKEVSAVISATTGHTSIEITYGKPKVKEKHSVIISSDVKNGTITATPTTAYAGENITLTATPDGGYILSEWNVTTATGNVTVNDNAFVMPDEDVTVSATFVEAAHVPVYASVAELIAAGKPTTTGTKVTVTLTDEEIIRFHTLKDGTVAGTIIKIGTQEVEIFCKGTPSDWKVGGTISGTLTNCDWKLYDYNSSWELCPADYSELTYKAPLPTCATPVINIDENGVASMTCETAGATIHYTVGDAPADPTETSDVFSSATLTDGQTIKAIAFAEGYKPSAVASKKYTAGGAGPKTYTLTISTSDFSTTSYANNNKERTTKAIATDGSTLDVTWKSNQIMQFSNIMQWQKKNGALFNITDLGKITDIQITSTSGTFTKIIGNTSNPTENKEGGYFKISVGNAIGKTEKVVITFQK